jgi:hypothetical protein
MTAFVIVKADFVLDFTGLNNAIFFAEATHIYEQ